MIKVLGIMGLTLAFIFGSFYVVFASDNTKACEYYLERIENARHEHERADLLELAEDLGCLVISNIPKVETEADKSL